MGVGGHWVGGHKVLGVPTCYVYPGVWGTRLVMGEDVANPSCQQILCLQIGAEGDIWDS